MGFRGPQGHADTVENLDLRGSRSSDPKAEQEFCVTKANGLQSAGQEAHGT